MRTALAALILAATLCSVRAQEQERRLIDRLLKPDMSLQNPVQAKQFVARGSTPLAKQAPAKQFHVRGRPPEKGFFARMFRTRNFDTKTSRYENMQASLATRTKIAKAEVPYLTSAYREVELAQESGKAAEVSDFDGTRPFLIQGKSQKALSQKNQPLTIDEVRELLNKNK